MPQIDVYIDPSIELPELQIPLEYPSADESDKRNISLISQTKVYGIMAPILVVNETVIGVDEILYFSLECSGIVPTVDCTISDPHGFSTGLNPVFPDNSLQVIIVPPFDNVYKKINLLFYITSINIDNINNILHIKATYKLPGLFSSMLKSFGKIKLFDSSAESSGSLATEICGLTNLGLASNISDTSEHYVYAANRNIMDILYNEMPRYSGQTEIYNCWVDLWNYLTVVNEYERYNSQDSESEMMIWTMQYFNDIEKDVKAEPVQLVAMITNNILMQNSELYVTEYKTDTNASVNMRGGTDTVVSYYDGALGEYVDILLQDSDTKRDIFTVYEYLGEDEGGSEILKNAAYYNKYKQKMSLDTIKVTISAPALGIIRGSKVNFIWYETDEWSADKEDELRENGISTGTTELDDLDLGNEYSAVDTTLGKYQINESVSGQYYVMSTELIFTKGSWNNVLTLGRPISRRGNTLDYERDY